MKDGGLDRISGLPLPPLRRLRRALRDPVRTQRRVLQELLSTARHTEWGRAHDFARTLRYRDLLSAFRDRQPPTAYADVQAFVARARDGERDVLWPGRIRHFGISSGTASSGQVIPVSAAMLRHMTRCALVPGLVYAGHRGLGYLGGKILSIPGGVSEDPQRPGVHVGEVSGLMAAAVPSWLSRWFQALPRDLMLMEGWGDKLRAIARVAAGQDVRAIVMVPSWAPLLFDTVLAQLPARADGSRTLRDAWPALRVFFSGGVALRSYRRILARYLGPDVNFVESYSASEGFFAFQDRLHDPDLLLHVDSGVFYEFVPRTELGAAMPTRHSVAEVEPGVDYALFVSTCSGLWAYDVQDVIRFTSIRPLRLEVVGRTGTILDEFGEALHADEVELALAHAADLHGVECLHWHVTYGPRSDTVTQHEWLVELAGDLADRTAFAADCDRYLQERNRHYVIRREPGVLAAPRLTVLPRGTTETYLRRTRRRLSVQTKLPSMRPQRDVADGLIEAAHALRVPEPTA